MNFEGYTLSESRRQVIDKITEYERLGGDSFFLDVENDPPSRTLMPEDVDYLYTKFSNKMKSATAEIIDCIGGKVIAKKHDIEIVGEENLRGIVCGAIFTANHFNRFENIAVKMAFKKMDKPRKFWKVVREGNYFMTGLIGFLLKYCNTLPLSSSSKTMAHLGKAIEKLLARGDSVLIYPEQSMWYNYTKPRAYRIGAFHYAAKFNAPIIPCFTTLSPIEGKIDDDGAPYIKYTLHIMKPIYPDPSLSVHQNADRMMKENFELCRAKYEEIYNRALIYGDGNL